jgi:C4-dicarboxylate-binding protein DctP
LRAGKLDGQENTPVNIYSQNLHEMQSHLTVTNHGYLAYAVIVNKAFWDKLPADLRATLEDAMRDATAYQNSLSELANAQALERIKASGKLNVVLLTPTERIQLQRAMEPVYQASRAWINPALVRSIQAVTGSPP